MSNANEWLASLYRENRRQLFLIAWGILRDAALAEDAVHAAFVGLAGLPIPPREPRPYAFRAVRNAALSLRSGRLRLREQSIEASAEAAAENSAPKWQLRQAIEQAIGNLDESSREVVELHLHAGLTFQQIADLTDEPLGTITSRYRRALAKIREQVEVIHG